MFFRNDSILYKPFNIYSNDHDIDLFEYKPEILKFKHHLSKKELYREHQIEYVNYFEKFESEGRKLFHLTVTYLPYQHREYSVSDVNKFFTNFYVKNLLPTIFKSRNLSKKQKSIQPVTYTFIDEHEPKPIKISNNNSERLEFPTRLHHHSILAVHPDTLDPVTELVGENIFTRNKFSQKVMTTDLRPCDPSTFIYVSKMIDKYPDYLQFPPIFQS